MKKTLLSFLPFIALGMNTFAQILDKNITSNKPSVCEGNDVDITVQTSQSGIYYSLINEADSVLAGPVLGTGSDLVMNSGAIKTSQNLYVSAMNPDSVSRSLYFDGIDNQITAAPIRIKHGTEVGRQMFVSAWVKTTASGATRYIASKYDQISGFILYLNAAGSVLIEGQASGNNYATSGASTTLVNDGNWHFIAGEINVNAGTISIAVDGNIENTGTIKATALGHVDNVANCFIGWSGTGSRFLGAMDDVRIYARAMDSTDYRDAMYNCIVDNSYLLAHYRFSETGGTTAKCSATGRDASATGFTLNDRIANATNICPGTMILSQQVAIAVSDFTNGNITPEVSNICEPTDVTITTTPTESGALYYLRNDATNKIVDGPILSNGGAIDFNTGLVSESMNYNVYAHSTPNNKDYSLTFDGLNDYVSAGVGTRGITTAITITGWIKTTANGYQFFCNKYNTTSGFLIFVDLNGKLKLDGRDASGSYKTSGASSQVINDGQFHFVAGVIDVVTGEWSVYVDGQLGSTTMNTTGTTLANNADLIFGMIDNAYFKGDMNQISLWNKAMNAQEILQIKNKCLDGNEDFLVANYEFSEGTGATTKDNSLSNVPGVLKNMTNSNWVENANSTCVAETYNTCSSELAKTVEINFNPIDTLLIVNGNTISAAKGNASYSWMYCDETPIVGENDSIYTIQESGEYAAIIDNGTCIDTTECVYIVITNIDSKESESSFSIFPNPANDFITISGTVGTIIKIKNLTGIELASYKMSDSNMTISLSQFPSTLLIEMISDQFHEIKKIERY